MTFNLKNYREGEDSDMWLAHLETSDDIHKSVLLDNVLKDFRAAPQGEKEAAFAEMLPFIRVVATKGAVECSIEDRYSLREFDAWFKAAFKKAARTPLETESGILENWAVGHVGFALNSEARPTGLDVTEGNEGNVHYVVTKTVSTMLMEETAFNVEGMLNSEGRAYLRSLGAKLGGQDAPNSLYFGAVKPVEIEGSTCYIAGGSCLFNYENPKVKEWMEKTVLLSTPVDKFAFAAVAEKQIAEIVVTYLKEGRRATFDFPIKPHKVTETLELMSLLH